MTRLIFDNQVVVVTGAGAGLGKAYALFFGQRHAKVVVNDLGGSGNGEGRSSKAADVVVAEIKTAGGIAVPNYDSVENGERIIQTAIDHFGRIDVLINNAGILRDKSLKNMTDRDWDIIFQVHVQGPYKTTRAAWPYFLKQNYGRVVNTASDSAIFGNFGQTNYAAAKLSQIGFTKALANEGFEHNILVNVIAPAAASRLTDSVNPPEVQRHLKPDWVVPCVGFLVHSTNKSQTGSIFEFGGGYAAELRWRVVQTLLQPKGEVNFSLKGKVVLFTGSGSRFGKSYAQLLTRSGACVVHQDTIKACKVTSRIHSAGIGAEDGTELVKACIDYHGRVDVLINDPGPLAAGDFQSVGDPAWKEIYTTHLRPLYVTTKAVWPYYSRQKHGRILNLTKWGSIYGNATGIRQATADCGILGFSRALALEGAKNNIHINTIASSDEPLQTLENASIAAFLLAACCDNLPNLVNGSHYELSENKVTRIGWERSGGYGFPVDVKLTPENVAQKWHEITAFSEGTADYPESIKDALTKTMANMDNRSGAVKGRL